jgi:predicted transcriptional regulator YdeE
MAVDDDTPVLPGTMALTIPSADYAVLACAVRSIGETYRYFFTEWLPGSDLKLLPGAPSFEQYPPEGEEERPVLIHIPVRKQEKS